jgi:branched-subunit amino acid ABC-type transport system permease component
MSDLLPFIIIGVTSGSIYALAAMGLVLTYKTSGIFNFAHGAQAAIGAYLMYQLRDVLGLPWPIAAVLTLALAGVTVGLLLERVAQALANVNVAARVAATVGMLIAIQGALVAYFGSQPLRMRYFLPTKLVTIFGVETRVEQVIIALLVAGAAAGLYLFLGRSRLGVSMQAVVDDPGLLALDAINPTLVRRSAWVIGSCFAAASGALLAPTTGLDAGLLTLLVFYAFGAAAVGAFNSLPLTYAGGIAIGVGAATITKYLNATSALAALPSTLPFLVLFVALLVTNRSKLVERGGQVVRPAMPEIAWTVRTKQLAAAAAVLVAIAVPHVVGTRLPLYMTAMGYIVLFISLGLLVRTSGQISLCQITFAAVGASSFAHLSSSGLPWPAAVLLASLVAVPVGALVAIPAIRLSGVYLAIATFGFGLLVQSIVFPSFLMFGNFSKVLLAPRPTVGPFDLTSDTAYYYLLVAAAIASAALAVLVRRSRLGRLLRGLADSPIALDAHGANTNVTRVFVFCISAFLAGLAGALTAPITGSVTGVPYQFTNSLLLVAVLYIAGRQPIAGPVVASLLFIVVPGYTSNATLLDLFPVAFGAGALIAAAFGGLPLLARLSESRRLQERPAGTRWRARTIAEVSP